MVTAEVDNVNRKDWVDMVRRLDEDLGYDCYTNGQRNHFLRLTRCMDLPRIVAALAASPTPPPPPCPPHHADCPEYIRWGSRRISGNMYCVHRGRAAALNHAFMTHALHTFAGHRRGHAVRDAMLGVPPGVTFTAGKGFGGDHGKMGEWKRYYGRNATSGERRWSNPLVTD